MTGPRAFVPFLHVADVSRSIAFYRQLGFEVRIELATDGGSASTWAYLESGYAQLMLARAGEPVIPSQQAVLFYLYVDDVAAKHKQVRDAGIAAEDIRYPFYCPDGEFRIDDPDGYCVMITHT